MNKDIEHSGMMTVLFLLAGEGPMFAYFFAGLFAFICFLCWLFPDE